MICSSSSSSYRYWLWAHSRWSWSLTICSCSRSPMVWWLQMHTSTIKVQLLSVIFSLPIWKLWLYLPYQYQFVVVGTCKPPRLQLNPQPVEPKSMISYVLTHYLFLLHIHLITNLTKMRKVTLPKVINYLACSINHDLFSILLRVSLYLLLNSPNIDPIYQIEYCGIVYIYILTSVLSTHKHKNVRRTSERLTHALHFFQVVIVVLKCWKILFPLIVSA